MSLEFPAPRLYVWADRRTDPMAADAIDFAADRSAPSGGAVARAPLASVVTPKTRTTTT